MRLLFPFLSLFAMHLSAQIALPAIPKLNMIQPLMPGKQPIIGSPANSTNQTASLSRGVLDEEMQTKAIEIYSNTAFNTKTQTIEKFVIDNEEEYPIDLVTFALSVDPLAVKFAHVAKT